MASFLNPVAKDYTACAEVAVLDRMKSENATLTPAKIPLISQEVQLRLLLETINDPDMQVIDCKNSKKSVVSRRGS